MEYKELLKQDRTSVQKMIAEKSEELRALRFSMTEKNTRKALAIRRELSRMKTALKAL